MEATLITIGIATLPIVALLYYFWHKDKGEKEPLPLLRKVFFYGILVIFPVAAFEVAADIAVYSIWPEPPALYWLAMPFLLVALPEEYAKLHVVNKVAYNHHKFNELMDGISYCIVASMGFAAFENIIYTFEYGVGTGILRAFTAVPAHAMFSGIMGYYIGLAKFTKKPAQVKVLFKRGLIAGVIFHGLYDFLLMSGIPILILLVIPLLIYMWVKLHKVIRLAHQKPTPALEEVRVF